MLLKRYNSALPHNHYAFIENPSFCIGLHIVKYHRNIQCHFGTKKDYITVIYSVECHI